VRSEAYKNFKKAVKVMTQGMFAVLILMFSGACCLAQDEVTVEVKGKKQPWPAEQVQKLYLSACSVVQREFGQTRAPKPKVTVVLGAEKNQVDIDSGEIKLKKWDELLFTQGVVLLAFEDLMPMDQRVAMTKRAVGWAEATVNISRLEH